MAGFYIFCNCCGHGFGNANGARDYLLHLSKQCYYGVRLSPIATWALCGRARDFLIQIGQPLITTFSEWVEMYYKDWTPSGPDVIPYAYAWGSFAHVPKAPEYQAWQREHGLIP